MVGQPEDPVWLYSLSANIVEHGVIAAGNALRSQPARRRRLRALPRLPPPRDSGTACTTASLRKK
jgi:hypothetical protein